MRDKNNLRMLKDRIVPLTSVPFLEALVMIKPYPLLIFWKNTGKQSLLSKKTLEVEVHEEETIREENQSTTTHPLDPPVEENPTDETLGDENQLGNASFMKYPEDEVHLEENLENDNCLRDIIPLGSPEREIHDEKNWKVKLHREIRFQLKPSLMLT